MVHFNNKWESKLHHISVGGLHHFPLFVKDIVAESNGGKATLIANVLAIQNLLATHYTANDDAFSQLSLPFPDNYEPLNLINVDEVQAIVEALPKRKAPDPDGITNKMQKKMP
ncbi:hypothetical protein Zmor_022067 [Zophobas morio]|jgi:hypothetical protein|uniref:Uncharacterized protein n=1 Tax=Zophobas morio TaxID=2755281 RepID=A0AA38HL86_9CUCU|nr:hypothetical protein Zmor_022067 [Zophobas morio]